jgi:hypothetical protein
VAGSRPWFWWAFWRRSVVGWWACLGLRPGLQHRPGRVRTHCRADPGSDACHPDRRYAGVADRPVGGGGPRHCPADRGQSHRPADHRPDRGRTTGCRFVCLGVARRAVRTAGPVCSASPLPSSSTSRSAVSMCSIRSGNALSSSASRQKIRAGAAPRILACPDSRCLAASGAGLPDTRACGVYAGRVVAETIQAFMVKHRRTIVTKGGVAFLSGTLDYCVRGYDVTDWRQALGDPLPAAGQATPMTYWTDKSQRQFVLVVAGGHGSIGTKAGDAIIAHAFPSS